MGPGVKRILVRGFLASLLLFLGPSATLPAIPSPIKVEVKPGVSSTYVKYATLAINDTVRFFSDTYKISLQKKLRMILAPDDETYKTVLMQEFKHTEANAAKLARQTAGMAKEGKGEYLLAYKAKASYDMTEFMKGICHELIHWYQYQAGGEKSIQIKWLTEGTATVLSYYRVEALLGEGALETYRKKSLNALKKAAKVPSLRELYSRKDWNASMEGYGATLPYNKAGLAVMELAQRSGYEALFAYFMNLKNLAPAKAFEKAFGLNLQKFENDMDQKYRK